MGDNHVKVTIKISEGAAIMGLWSGTKGFFSKALDWRFDRWLGVEQIQDTFVRTKLIVKDMVVPQKAEHPETFQDAMERLSLTEQDLAQRKREFTILLIAFAIIGLSVLAYGGYMLYKGHAWITLICIFLSLYAFTQTFRFHFWLFQLKKRKLGCTFTEWFNSEIHTSQKPEE